MTTDSMSSQAFPFLFLPAELRNRIYSCLFEDASPVELEVCDARSHLPDPAITSVCRKVRGETLLLYYDSVRSFCSSHHFRISIASEGDRAPQEECVLRHCKPLPFGAIIDCLTVLITRSATDIEYMKLEARTTYGRETVWSARLFLMTKASTDGLAGLEEILAVRCKLVTVLDTMKHPTPRTEGLNVEACIRVVYEFLRRE